MRVAVFSTKPYDRTYLGEANAAFQYELAFFEPRLTAESASLAAGVVFGTKPLTPADRARRSTPGHRCAGPYRGAD